MGDVINLNKVRKKKAKETREQRAATNRRLHGRTKAERAVEELQKKMLERRVDGALRVPPGASTTSSDGLEGEVDEDSESSS